MIKVTHLSKRYANVYAVDDISFEVEDGEILGFLGPNGAGKSTTMRILTCFMPATSGSATIGGFDVFNDSLKVRQIIGYLPENVPLYTEMRVNEYLLFRARLKKVPSRERKERVEECIERCGIKDVQRQIIGTLSKGYRQRVGLADTLVHNPKILIMDEPTIGLDPNQIRQVREIIKELGEKRTVLISTHILPEVEMICKRVVIINKGKIAAEGTPQGLINRSRYGGNIIIQVKGDAAEVKSAILKIDGILKVTVKEEERETPGHASSRNNGANNEINTFIIEQASDMDSREMIFNCMVKNNFVLLEMKKESVSLEDIFHQITTREEGG